MQDGDKTEDPTGTKLDEARQKGDIARSKEFANFFVFLGCVASLSFAGTGIIQGLADVFLVSFDLKNAHLESIPEFVGVINRIAIQTLWILSPILAGVCFAAVVGNIGQFGFLLTGEKLKPDFEKLNPIDGFKRLVTKETFFELFKATFKMVVISIILYLCFEGEISNLLQLGTQPIPFIFKYAIEQISTVLNVVLIFLATLGILDLGFQKWAYWQRMKMTVQEVKDEFKNKEGDPQIKSRIRQMQRDRARARMMEEVPKANVIVTNPTHVAVALKYERGQMRAPVVVAKGAGFIAVKIKELAAQSGVPILEKRELARYLYKNVEVNEMIPESLYTAVAEVLAYVYRIRKQFRSFINQEAS